jgi:hypothetical protein
MSFAEDQKLPVAYSMWQAEKLIPNCTVDQIKAITKEGYAYTLDMTNPREPRKLLCCDDLGAVAALNEISAFGVKRKEFKLCASDALYVWASAHNRPPPGLDDDATPIAAAMIGAKRGEEWVLEIAEFRHVSDNRRQLLAAVFDKNGPPPMPYEPDSGFLPSAKMTLELVHVLSALMQNLAGAN